MYSKEEPGKFNNFKCNFELESIVSLWIVWYVKVVTGICKWLSYEALQRMVSSNEKN